MPDLDRSLTDLAGRQHGTVTRRQLLDLGASASWIDRRVAKGGLRPLHRGVYLLGSLQGSLVPPGARYMAALLAAGPGAVISHVSALAFHGLTSKEPPRAPVHVCIVGVDRSRRPGIRAHRATALPEADVQTVDGLRVTTPARSLVDSAGSVAPRTLEQALARALRDGLVATDALERAVARRGRLAGADRLRHLLRAGAEPAFTRSQAEERLLAWIRKADLPDPETNVRVDDMEVDFVWRALRVVVEMDGFTFHSSRSRFEEDRRRDARLASRGYRSVRVTWQQLEQEPVATVVRVAQVLAVAESERDPLLTAPAGSGSPAGTATRHRAR